MSHKIKLTLTEHAVKKAVLEHVFNEKVNPEDYEGYFILDELGSPNFILETKD